MKAIALLVITIGCGVEEDFDTGETSQGLNWATWVTYGTSDDTDFDLGPTNDRTCFLTGIRGSLRGTSDAGAFRVWDSARDEERWKVRTRTSASYGVRVMVGCVAAVQGRVTMHATATSVDHLATDTVASSETRQCFLQNLRTSGSDGFVNARLDKMWEGKWLLQAVNTSGQTTATAVCVDVPAHSGPTRVIAIASEYRDYDASAAPTDGVVSEKLFDNDGSWMCGLRGVAGTFADNWDRPGAEVFLNSSGNWVSRIAGSDPSEINSGRTLVTRCLR